MRWSDWIKNILSTGSNGICFYICEFLDSRNDVASFFLICKYFYKFYHIAKKEEHDVWKRLHARFSPDVRYDTVYYISGRRYVRRKNTILTLPNDAISIITNFSNSLNDMLNLSFSCKSLYNTFKDKNFFGLQNVTFSHKALSCHKSDILFKHNVEGKIMYSYDSSSKGLMVSKHWGKLVRKLSISISLPLVYDTGIRVTNTKMNVDNEKLLNLNGVNNENFFFQILQFVSKFPNLESLFIKVKCHPKDHMLGFHENGIVYSPKNKLFGYYLNQDLSKKTLYTTDIYLNILDSNFIESVFLVKQLIRINSNVTDVSIDFDQLWTVQNLKNINVDVTNIEAPSSIKKLFVNYHRCEIHNFTTDLIHFPKLEFFGIFRGDFDFRMKNVPKSLTTLKLHVSGHGELGEFEKIKSSCVESVKMLIFVLSFHEMDMYLVDIDEILKNLPNLTTFVLLDENERTLDFQKMLEKTFITPKDCFFKTVTSIKERKVKYINNICCGEMDGKWKKKKKLILSSDLTFGKDRFGKDDWKCSSCWMKEKGKIKKGKKF